METGKNCSPAHIAGFICPVCFPPAWLLACLLSLTTNIERCVRIKKTHIHKHREKVYSLYLSLSPWCVCLAGLAAHNVHTCIDRY